MASPASSAVVSAASRAAAAVRAAVTAAACSASSAASASRRAASAASASSEVSSPASRSRAASAQASTPSTSAAYLRVSAFSSACRDEHRGQPLRVGVEPVEVAGELGADVGEQRQRLGQPAVERGQLGVVGGGEPVPGVADQRRARPGASGPPPSSAPTSAACAVCGDLAQVVGGGQPARLRDQLDVLARLRVDRARSR